MKLSIGKAVAKAKQKSVASSKVYPLINDTEGKAEKDETISVAPAKKAEAKQQGAKWEAPKYSHTRRVDYDRETVSENRCVSLMTDSLESSMYEVLRTQILLAAKKDGLRTLMITSAEPGDGKTLTSINLACSFAKSHNQTVLLVDADFKKQQIHKYLGMDVEFGLGDYLIDERPIEDCLVWPGIDKMVLISGGKTLLNSSELISSPMMVEFVHDVRNRYEDRFIFFDAPPVLAGADTMALAQMVDGIVVVAQTGKTAKENFLKAVELLPKEKIIGVVMNNEVIAHNNYYGYNR